MPEPIKLERTGLAAPCSHCGEVVPKNKPRQWVSPHCCPGHEYERDHNSGGSVSIICLRCARKLGYYLF